MKRQAKASWPWWQLPADFEAHRLAVLVSAVAPAIGHQVDELKAAAIPRPRDRWPGSHRETARKQASAPGTIRPRWVRSFHRGFPALVTDAPRIEWIRGALSRRAASQLWWYMSVPVEMPVVCTWTLGTLAATAGIAEPTKADPAKPSATIAGMMMARPMRMTPPANFQARAGAAPVVGACAPAGVITNIWPGNPLLSTFWTLIVAHTICALPASTMSFNMSERHVMKC